MEVVKNVGLLGGRGFHGVGRAPAFGGDDLVAKRGTRTGCFACLAGVEDATGANLLGLVLRVFLGVYLGGVFLVAEGLADGIVFGEFDRRRGVGGEGTAGEKRRRSGGCGKFQEEVTS